MPQIVLNPPDDTPTYATASPQGDSDGVRAPTMASSHPPTSCLRIAGDRFGRVALLLLVRCERPELGSWVRIGTPVAAIRVANAWRRPRPVFGVGLGTRSRLRPPVAGGAQDEHGDDLEPAQVHERRQDDGADVAERLEGAHR